MSGSERAGAIILGTSPGLKTGDSELPEPFRSSAMACGCTVQMLLAAAYYRRHAEVYGCVRDIRGYPAEPRTRKVGCLTKERDAERYGCYSVKKVAQELLWRT